MQKLIFLVLILFTFTSYSQSTNQKDSITCYRITSVVHFEKDDSVSNGLMNDTTFIFLSGKVVLYQRPNSYHYSHTSSPKSKWDFQTWTTQYMIFDSSAKEGFYYTDLENLGWKNVDSFIQKVSFVENGRNLFDEMKDILLAAKPTSKSLQGDVLLESYTFNNSLDTSVKGTITFKFYTKLNDCPISLSPGIDSLKQMKLGQIKIEMPEFFSKEKNRICNAFSMATSLDLLPVNKSQDFKRNVEKYLWEKQRRQQHQK